MSDVHLCVTGDLGCSGINPCEGCLSATLTHVLVPAMKAAGIHERDDARVVLFLQTYHRSREALLQGVATSPNTVVMVPPPSVPPIADVPLTTEELEGMARAAAPEEVVDTAAETVPVPDQAADSVPLPTPAGLLSDEEFREKFPTVAPEMVMDMPEPPPPPPPAPEVPLPRKSEPSLLRLASQALTPNPLPTADKASESSEAGIAPPLAPPSPASQPKAPTDDVSAVPASAQPNAETTKEAEATTHG